MRSANKAFSGHFWHYLTIPKKECAGSFPFLRLVATILQVNAISVPLRAHRRGRPAAANQAGLAEVISFYSEAGLPPVLYYRQLFANAKSTIVLRAAGLALCAFAEEISLPRVHSAPPRAGVHPAIEL
jgi:hypothetical protein